MLEVASHFKNQTQKYYSVLIIILQKTVTRKLIWVVVGNMINPCVEYL